MTTRTKTAMFLAALLALCAFSCFLLWGFSHPAERSFAEFFGGRPLPNITQLCLDYRLAILLMPAPWIIAAVRLVARNDVSPFPIIVFISTLILVLLTMAIVVIFGFAIPWLPMIIGMHRR